MKNAKKHIRWKAWDYGSSGAYFITICTQNKETFFGKIRESCISKLHPESKLLSLASYLDSSEIGLVAWNNWKSINSHYPFAHLDAFVLMPNHLHGILIFEKKSKDNWESLQFGPQKDNLPDIVRTYKGSVTRYANLHKIPFKWQSRYHDRVIRDSEELARIRNYIWNNPSMWRR